jgi:hypothetical protein
LACTGTRRMYTLTSAESIVKPNGLSRRGCLPHKLLGPLTLPFAVVPSTVTPVVALERRHIRLSECSLTWSKYVVRLRLISPVRE